MKYFISDLHIGHTNVLAYDNRPFKTIEEHDSVIMQNWNARVTGSDDVYILGDIGFANSETISNYYRQLKGNKHLILGNHDKMFFRKENEKLFKNVFCEVVDYMELYLDKKHSIVLCHYPIPCFKNSFHGWLHFYGHVHNSFDSNMMEHDKMLIQNLYSKNTEEGGNKTDVCRMYNVGCMIPYMNYTPRTVAEILATDNCDIQF